MKFKSTPEIKKLRRMTMMELAGFGGTLVANKYRPKDFGKTVIKEDSLDDLWVSDK